MYISQKLSLKQTSGNIPPQYLVELQSLDPNALPELLEEARFRIITYKKEKNSRGKKGNFISTDAFKELIVDFKNNYSSDSKPLFFVQDDCNIFSCKYNSLLADNVSSELSKFKSENVKSIDLCFSISMKEALENIKNTQKKITDYVINEQKNFIDTLDVFEMKHLTQQKVADAVGEDVSVVCRYLKNLTVDLPNLGVINVKSLVNGNSYSGIMISYALNELKADSSFYDGGWIVTSQRVSDELKNKFNLDFKRRYVSSFMNKMEFNTRVDGSINQEDLYDEIWQELEYMKDNPRLCVNNAWKLNTKQFSELFTKEYGVKIDSEFMFSLLDQYSFIGNGPALKEYK